MKRKNIFFTTLNTIYWNIFIFFETCLNLIIRNFIYPILSSINYDMDWNNRLQQNNQDQNDLSEDSSTSGDSSSSSSTNNSSDDDMDTMMMLDRDEYVFKAYDLVKINYKLQKSEEFPVSRSGHRIIASDGHLYSLGGYNPRSARAAARHGRCLLFQELWSYNFATKKWNLLMDSQTRNMPQELASNALAIHNNLLISHGGTGYPFGECCSNDCHIFVTGQHRRVFRLTVEGDLPTAQYGPGIVIHDDYLYTIGGTTGFDYSCDVYRLNLKTKVWENVYICRPEMRDDPEGRYRHEVVYDGNHIFILGGGTSMTVYDLQTIPAFNLKSNTWDYFETKPDPTIRAGMPKPRKCFSCVQLDTPNGVEAYITGGLQSDFQTYFADVWKINFRTMQWTLIKTAVLPRPLYFHSATTPGNGCMYIFGGIEYNKTAMRRRNDLYKMWMTIPKLSEMCWDAITFYNPNLDKYKRNYLLKIGIPERFVDRVIEPKSSTINSNSSASPSLSKRNLSLTE
ncbi:kelch domain-containing protein 10 homolog [Episyrphus balteatus]|uniref:kelch domain-containing protein 10 homolog n=1 Tax=Episyrphus balteatus TaxID=286459 RepID=UPI002484E0C4|nr:kelch domain-containing protein 10 homolog [Episyrphus balteatus]